METQECAKVCRCRRHGVVCEIGPESLNFSVYSNVCLQALNCRDLWNEGVVARLMKQVCLPFRGNGRCVYQSTNGRL